MGTKDKLLGWLESHKGIYCSGEEIAKELGVSRASVWKGIKALQKEGYCIDAVTNKGYCLSAQTDILSSQGIRKYLDPSYTGLDVVVLPSVDSTNAMVRERANAGTAEGYTVVANEQTAGLGRSGRGFFSPPDTGIYLSLLLRPHACASQQAVKTTTMAAVAACEAIEAVSEENAQIKWVNDIYVSGKKVAGILTAASFDLENGMLDYAVLGIGFNVYPPKAGFPAELEQIAGTVFRTAQADAKNHLAGEFLNRFMKYYTSPNPTDYVERYRSRSLVIGKPVCVTSGTGDRNALVRGIDDQCRLLVTYDDGAEDCLSYGEISIRL